MADTVEVGLYLNSICFPPYIGYKDSDGVIHQLAFITDKAVKKMVADPSCFTKAAESIWKKKILGQSSRQSRSDQDFGIDYWVDKDELVT